MIIEKILVTALNHFSFITDATKAQMTLWVYRPTYLRWRMPLDSSSVAKPQIQMSYKADDILTHKLHELFFWDKGIISQEYNDASIVHLYKL